jgi:hypothetical protein
MSILGSYRLFNKLDNGSLSGAQLETLLAGSRELAEFKQLCDTTQAASALAASPTAVAAIAGSAIATQAVLDNRKNFDILARQRLSFAGIGFMKEFFNGQTNTILIPGGKYFYIPAVFNNGKFLMTTSDGSASVDFYYYDPISNIIQLASTIVSVIFPEYATYGNNLYVLVGANSSSIGSSNSVILTSPDGAAWTSRNHNAVAGSIRCVAFGNGRFVAVGVGTTNAAITNAWTSTDGLTWTRNTGLPSGAWSSVKFGNGVFVAVGTNVVARSTDGITWTTGTIPTGTYKDLAFGNGIFVAVTGSAHASSTDGLTWTTRSIPTGTSASFGGVVFGDGLFVVHHSAGNSNNMISTDGINWDYKIFTLTSTSNLRTHGYGNGMFIFGSPNTSGGGNGLITRSISSSAL